MKAGLSDTTTHDDDSMAVLESLFTAFYPTLAVYCRKYVKDGEAARDIIQDIFLKVWENRCNLDFSVSLHSYLLKLAHHHCINYLQRMKVEKKYLHHVSIQLLEMETRYDDLFDRLATDALQERIDRTVEQLPEQCRDIFQKSRYEGMSHKDIAQALNISVRTVETQIYRALKVLKKKIFLLIF